MVIGSLCSSMLYITGSYRETWRRFEQVDGRVPSKVLLCSTGFVSSYFPELSNLNSDAVGELFMEVFAVAQEEQNLSDKSVIKLLRPCDNP